MKHPNAQNVTLQGVAISPGLAIGNAYVYRDIMKHEHKPGHITNADVDAEWTRIENAIDQVCKSLKRTATKIEERINTDAAMIFLAQEAMLQDSYLLDDLQDTLKEEQVHAEQVVKQVFSKWVKRFRKMKHKGVEQTGEDVKDLARRIIMVLQGIEDHALESLPPDSIVVAQRLLPSDTLFLSRENIKAVILEKGGQVSHTAILLRGLGVPCAANIARIREQVEKGDTVFVDGTNGRVIVRPDDEHKAELFEHVKQHKSDRAQALKRCKEKAITRNGLVVTVMANISCREDAERAVANGADGIGLYRTEHLFLSRESPPSENKIFEILNAALAPLQGKPITLRLLDAGGDKHVPYLNAEADKDPFQGRRGIRLLFEHEDLLTAQLRAFVRLSSNHDIRIMVPMVTLTQDMQRTRKYLAAAAKAEGITQVPQLGAMIETPAAALCVAEIANESDFLAIGTNDLTQYTMATGRENNMADAYFVDNHPAVLRLIKIVATEAHGCSISLCGELAARPAALPSLLDLGITNLSVTPPLIPEIKAAIRNL